MRFKVDENLPVELCQSLRAKGYDVLSIHDQRMVGSADPQVAAVCRSEQRALLTLDLDFSDIRAYPPADYAGIIVLRPRNQSQAAVIGLVDQLIPMFASEPMTGSLWIVQEAGVRIRE